jgi:hypothetical protein
MFEAGFSHSSKPEGGDSGQFLRCHAHGDSLPVYSIRAQEVLLHLQFILCDVLKVKPVEVREIAVPAADGEVPAPDNDVMGTGYFAVPAVCCAHQFPRVVAPDLCECTWSAHILQSWDKDAGCTAVVARDLCLIRNRFDNLICNLFTAVTIGAVGQKDEPVAHVMYLHLGIYECVAPFGMSPSLYTIYSKEPAGLIGKKETLNDYTP